MHKLWQQKKKEAEAHKTNQRGSPARIRLQKELGELETTPDLEVVATDLMHFSLIYRPQEGHYHGGEFRFKFDISESYPHEAPKVLCKQTIFHPNIDPEGHICLNILREEWNPVLNIQAVIFGLQLLFLEPNKDDPLNKDAAEMMAKDRQEFIRTVRSSMRGRSIGGIHYSNVLVAPESSYGSY
ncbi:NEDD8-conjugating protein ubc12 [Coemansia spiralis]|uniref:NEDD8-conjugating enzyme UBC12 n=2 Tax=Coemansia TaxID=4863 RepID=A0A9W8G5P1_9FUNG|nr:ubiquitin-conjugating enzyme/RWD-like protein [Coemansia spiralis]KAJ1994823.1 NEDD8-conjugating protein ubc12 [Coemansia umbellata]KAJ2624475.1 NEDD8-conjugating protein ubc12 [Coemansia sp. RSA 1358]KAJ2679560.1 NEDD8-conjugating protein ubc12 [Coemansia spiralis]